MTTKKPAVPTKHKRNVDIHVPDGEAFDSEACKICNSDSTLCFTFVIL